jgi:hypothetical protein
VTWRTAEQGCAERPFPGIRLSLTVAGDHVLCVLHPAEGAPSFARGGTGVAEIVLPYGARYAARLAPGHRFDLTVGARVIASGVVLPY